MTACELLWAVGHSISVILVLAVIARATASTTLRIMKVGTAILGVFLRTQQLTRRSLSKVVATAHLMLFTSGSSRWRIRITTRLSCSSSAATSKLSEIIAICNAWLYHRSIGSLATFTSSSDLAVCRSQWRLTDTSRYYAGEKVAPVLTIVIGGNHEASNYLWEL